MKLINGPITIKMDIYDKDIFGQCKACKNIVAIMATPKSSNTQRWVYTCNLKLEPHYNKNCEYFIPDVLWKEKPYNRISNKIESFNTKSQTLENKKGYDIEKTEVKKKMENEGQQKLVPYDGEVVGEIELPKIDVKQYIGKKVKIVSADKMKGDFGPCLRIMTEIVETIEGGKKPIELRGSLILGLHQDADGNVGWGAETKTGQFMKKAKVKAYTELVGKTVTLQVAVRKGIDFLTFTL